MNSLKNYYDYLSSSKEFPETLNMIKAAGDRMGYDWGKEEVKSENTDTSNTTIVDFVLNKMAGESVEDIETVLLGIGTKLDTLKSEGTNLTNAEVIEKLKNNSLL